MADFNIITTKKSLEAREGNLNKSSKNTNWREMVIIDPQDEEMKQLPRIIIVIYFTEL